MVAMLNRGSSRKCIDGRCNSVEPATAAVESKSGLARVSDRRDLTQQIQRRLLGCIQRAECGGIRSRSNTRSGILASIVYELRTLLGPIKKGQRDDR